MAETPDEPKALTVEDLGRLIKNLTTDIKTIKEDIATIKTSKSSLSSLQSEVDVEKEKWRKTSIQATEDSFKVAVHTCDVL